MLWPPLLVVMMLLAGRHWRWLAMGTIGVLIAVDEVAMRAHHSAGLGWTIIGSIATPILLGVAAALLTHHRTTFVPLARVLGRRWTNLVIVAATLRPLQPGAANELVAVLLTLPVIASCIREDTMLHPVLTRRPLVFVGTISYGVYLMHMLAANIVRVPLGHDNGVDVFVATIPVVAAPPLSATASSKARSCVSRPDSRRHRRPEPTWR